MLLRIEDTAYEKFMGMISLCSQVEVICESCAVEICSSTELCVANAISEMQKNRVLRQPSDYTYIMMAANESVMKGLPFFYSPKDFLDYLKSLNLDHLPGRSTLYDTIVKVQGRYPDWAFTDNPKPSELIRRKNVVKQFLSAYLRAQRIFSDGSSDNR